MSAVYTLTCFREDPIPEWAWTLSMISEDAAVEKARQMLVQAAHGGPDEAYCVEVSRGRPEGPGPMTVMGYWRRYAGAASETTWVEARAWAC